MAKPADKPKLPPRMVRITKVIRSCYWHRHLWEDRNKLPRDILIAGDEKVPEHLEYVDIKMPDADSDLI